MITRNKISNYDEPIQMIDIVRSNAVKASDADVENVLSRISAAFTMVPILYRVCLNNMNVPEPLQESKKLLLEHQDARIREMIKDKGWQFDSSREITYDEYFPEFLQRHEALVDEINSNIMRQLMEKNTSLKTVKRLDDV